MILGLPSNGLHTNGYSLARKLLFEVAQVHPGYLRQRDSRAKSATNFCALTRAIGRSIKKLVDGECVSAMAHITGGGITENLPRVLPRGLAAVIEMGSWPVLPIFEHLQQLGNVPQEEMFRTFNMGLGMLLVVPVEEVQESSDRAGARRRKSFTVGRIVKGDRKVMYT